MVERVGVALLARTLLAGTLVGCGTGAGPPASVHPSSSATASPPPAAGRVGPLFLTPAAALHICTASVVHSPAGTVVATAAHCIIGTGVGVTFAPGYDKGTSPYGTWTVVRAYADPAWIRRNDPRADVAFLVVKPSLGNPHASSVESVVGASTLSVEPAVGTRVTGSGYAIGSGDSALTCAAATTVTDGYPTLPCGPLPAGSSGGPWIAAGARLVGVVGGLHEGGCTDAVSYSPPFSAATATLLARAAAGGPGDTFPLRADDGC